VRTIVIAAILLAFSSGCAPQPPRFQAVSSGGKSYVLDTQTGEVHALEPESQHVSGKAISADVLKKYVESDDTPDVVKEFCVKVLGSELGIKRAGRFWVEEAK
jgi:hypothetical protein